MLICPPKKRKKEGIKEGEEKKKTKKRKTEGKKRKGKNRSFFTST